MNKASRSSGATIKDIAREAGVSYSTVSRVINNYEHIKPETRERVLTAITRLGYVANQQARSLVGGRSQVIGLVIHDFHTSYIGEILRGIDDAVAEAQYDLLLYTSHRRKSRESIYVGSLIRGLADGLLLVLPRNIPTYLDVLNSQSFPFVLIDYQPDSPDIPAVSATNVQGAYDAIQYLVQLGHERIAIITGDMETSSARDRLAGYKAALKDNGMSLDPELVYEGDYEQPSGFEGATHLLSLPSPPTAIFASNDMMAFGVYDAVRARGLRIAADISIIGVDDIPQAKQVYPSLTTVRQPLEQMGRQAAQMLLEWLNEKDGQRPKFTEVPTELIMRSSCDSPTDSVLYK